MPEETLGVFEIDRLELQYGGQLEHGRLVYATYGKLNADKSNAILFPTYYTGIHKNNAAIIGKRKALDPDKYFIIVPNMFGNGISSSPSNMPEPFQGADFPNVSALDNVRCQYRLLTEVFDIKKLSLIVGWSMGAIQAYQWATAYPDFVERMLCICSSAKTSNNNLVFLDAVKNALFSDAKFNAGRYSEKPVVGLKRFARVYAGWAYSQSFFRKALYKKLGFDDVNDLYISWEDDHLRRDANDLLAMLWTWQHADISRTPEAGGSFVQALSRIKARSIIMPCNTDLYFTVDDNAFEVAHIPDAELRVIDSDWGHIAGGPYRVPEVSEEIDATIRELLAA